MPPLRPFARQFQRPSSVTSKSPYLVSMIATPSNQQTAVTTSRTLSTTPIKAAGGGTHYEPPGGWLFGVPPGEKYKREGWENIWVYGFWGSLAVAVVAYAYKPDTSIQTWALEEARRRLEAEGILPDPEAKE